jgi:hypothetical protein
MEFGSRFCTQQAGIFTRNLSYKEKPTPEQGFTNLRSKLGRSEATL